MVKLDLHGVRHHDVKIMVEDFVYMNQHMFPLEIICGNSEKMIYLVESVMKQHKLDTHMYRYGIIIVRGWK